MSLFVKARFLLHRTFNQLLIASILLGVSARAGAQVNDTKATEFSATKIWDAARHSAFTDLVEWRGKVYCAFRIGNNHVPRKPEDDGGIQIIRSEDEGKSWESVTSFFQRGIDLRDPKLSVTPDDRLMILMGGSKYDHGKLLQRSPRVVFLDQLKTKAVKIHDVSIDQAIRTNDDWLWRVTWHQGVGYGVVYQAGENPWGAHLVKTQNGLDYQLVHTFKLKGKPNESTIRIDETGKMHIAIRNEDQRRIGHLGVADNPYDRFQWQTIDTRLGGPNFIELPGRYWLLGTREYNPKTRTVLGFLENDGKFKKFATLPSGGDTSYPGMLIRNRELWVSYYSSHEGRSSIYLAKIKLSKIRKN